MSKLGEKVCEGFFVWNALQTSALEFLTIAVFLRYRYDIVTDEESRINASDPESKQQSAVWVFQEEPNPTKKKLKKRKTVRVVHNHLFASYLSRNQESQPPLSHID